MSITRKETTVTRVVRQYAARVGMAVADLRAFLREVDEAGIPDATRVRHQDRLSHEGSAYSGNLSVEVQQIRDVPIVTSAEAEELS